MKTRLNDKEAAGGLPTQREKTEYDRFGPWALPVTTALEMPPRFDAWYAALEDSALIIKLPASVERRDTRAGRDLYVAVLAVGKTGVVHLGLDGAVVLRRDIAFGEIVALRKSLELLDGRLSFDLADGSFFAVAFNAVSAGLMDSFAREVRIRLPSPAGGWKQPSADLVPGPTENHALFHNLFRDLAASDEGLAILAWQEPCRLVPRPESGQKGLGGILARLKRWRLDGCLLTATASEFIVLRESTAPRTGKFKGYRYETLWLPASALIGAVVEDRVLPNGAPIEVLRLLTRGQVYELFFVGEDLAVRAQRAIEAARAV